jgi:hypothetical protein
VDRVDDPADARITADGLVLRVDEDDLEVFVGGILVDPVRVEDSQVGATAADTLFGGGAEGALVFELVHTLVGGFAWLLLVSRSYSCAGSFLTIGGTLGHRLLATTTSDTDAVDDIALLGLVSQAAGLVGSGGTRRAVDDIKLSELY